MVTGDNIQAAKAIALECGILSSDEETVECNIIEGKTFCSLSEKEREQVAQKITLGNRIGCTMTFLRAYNSIYGSPNLLGWLAEGLDLK